jgi:hypothetical protein
MSSATGNHRDTSARQALNASILDKSGSACLMGNWFH